MQILVKTVKGSTLINYTKENAISFELTKKCLRIETQENCFDYLLDNVEFISIISNNYCSENIDVNTLRNDFDKIRILYIKIAGIIN